MAELNLSTDDLMMTGSREKLFATSTEQAAFNNSVDFSTGTNLFGDDDDTNMDEFGLDSSMTTIDNNAMIEEESNVVDSENVLPPFITSGMEIVQLQEQLIKLELPKKASSSSSTATTTTSTSSRHMLVSSAELINAIQKTPVASPRSPSGLSTSTVVGSDAHIVVTRSTKSGVSSTSSSNNNTGDNRDQVVSTARSTSSATVVSVHDEQSLTVKQHTESTNLIQKEAVVAANVVESVDAPTAYLTSLEQQYNQLNTEVEELWRQYIDAPDEATRSEVAANSASTAASTYRLAAAVDACRRAIWLGGNGRGGERGAEHVLSGECGVERWRGVADGVRLLRARAALLGALAPDGDARLAGVVGQVVVGAQPTLPCCAMSKRQRSEGQVRVHWLPSPRTIVNAKQAGQPVPRPHHISARLVAADEVAEESFRRNVLGTSGPDRQFFKHQQVPLDDDNSATFSLLFVNGTTGHVASIVFIAQVTIDGNQTEIKSSLSRPLLLATHTRQWSGGASALLLSCLLAEDDAVDSLAPGGVQPKDIELGVDDATDSTDVSEDQTEESNRVSGGASAFRRHRAAADTRALDTRSRRVREGRKRSSSCSSPSSTTIMRSTPRQQAISEAFFGNVMTAHFERHARIAEHIDLNQSGANAARVTTTMPTMPVQRASLAVGDIGYLIGRLRSFAKTVIDRTADELLLERALGRFCEWFGAVLTMLRFQRPVAPMWATGVLFGFLSRMAAEKAVRGHPRGTCVIRFSERQGGHFAIAYVGSSEDGRVRHYLMSDSDMDRGLADFVLRKPHFTHILCFAGVADDGSTRLERIDKRRALRDVAEPSTGANKPVFEGYEGLD
mmetsp:Transcript_20339/g.34704  ORF Transcript_20339/g.34704 Transcript_20339/m.34704 type:complete len:845 (+) Transcript_20339:1192-3726(+)